MKKLALLAALAAALVAVAVSSGSSHREAPQALTDPTADWTDTYFFTPADDPGSSVAIGNVIPFEDPAGGPNFYEFDERAHYYLNFDNTGDGVYDIRYRFEFKRHEKRGNRLPLAAGGPVDSIRDLLVYQTYTVKREDYRGGKLRRKRTVARNVLVAPSNFGEKTMPNYDALVGQATKSLPGGGQVFAGQRDDPFYIDLGRTFDLVNLGGIGTGNAGGGRDTIAGYATHSIALKLPERLLTRDGKSVANANDPEASVGMWASTERRKLQVTDDRRGRGSGKYVQVNRLGNPLVNELIIGLPDKDKFNRTQPQDDAKNYAGYVVEPEILKALNALFNLNIKETDRTDLVTLITGLEGLNRISDDAVPADTLKLNLGVPPTAPGQESRFGVIGGDTAGYPNGRRLGDDVVDITLRVAGGYLLPESQGGQKLPLGDGVDRNDKPFLSSFPYSAGPTPGNLSDLQRPEPPHDPTPADPTGQP
jgi:Domain of unknown function (DUF4331)